MKYTTIFSSIELTKQAKALFAEERKIDKLQGWFYIKEIQERHRIDYIDDSSEIQSAKLLCDVARELPLSISRNAIFAGTQRDAFARSYALINPSFKVESFAGYCDPTAVFDDIDVTDEISRERIEKMRMVSKNTPYVKALEETYRKVEAETAEVAFFIEQVTGHIVPDFRKAIAMGIPAMIAEINEKLEDPSCSQQDNYTAFKTALHAFVILAERYAEIAERYIEEDSPQKDKWGLMAETLQHICRRGAQNLYEAIQMYILLWQAMCLEQSPNPFAFSAGNIDRIFEPYRKKDALDRGSTAALLKHLLVFYNVADRSWAISQNIIVSGRDIEGADLTNLTTYALLDAFYDMNLPQPILSVKLHKNTPDILYKELGRFFFTPGCLTPSLFNDDSIFEVLQQSGVDEADLPDYAIAGCQEPLIMGKDNGNTTNSWLNMAKILELTLMNGKSAISGKQIGSPVENLNAYDLLKNVRNYFYHNLERYVELMADSANHASRAVSLLPVPFLSTAMGGIESGYDMRDVHCQGTKYNGSGCLIHGLSVVADSFIAIDKLLAEKPEECEQLLSALKDNFRGQEDLRDFLLKCPKYGNGIAQVDDEVASLADKVSDLVKKQKNYLGNPFRVDFSTPSTHLLYGYWVGATPDGRRAREMLGYGIDPLYGDAQSGLGFRTLSYFKLPFRKMNGGYASHFGLAPNYFRSNTYEEKGMEFKTKVMNPLFFNEANPNLSPFYLYVNVTTPEILKKVMSNPAKYAPSGVYIMRIHGTFVNFLDLSKAIQEDIITRLDLKSTKI